MYKDCRVSMGKQLYLSEDFHFEASRLKLLARTNCLSINATLFGMSLSDNDRCSVCPLHRVEDLQHFALECPLYEDIRAEILSQNENMCSPVNIWVLSLRSFRHTISFYLCLVTMDSVQKWVKNRVITVFTVFRLLTDFVCLYNYEFWLSLCKIVRSSVILLIPLFNKTVSCKSF